MKPTDIRVGRRYRNRGAGKTRRTVLAITEKNRPEWDERKPFEDEVTYLQNGLEYKQPLSTFARWAGYED